MRTVKGVTIFIESAHVFYTLKFTPLLNYMCTHLIFIFLNKVHIHIIAIDQIVEKTQLFTFVKICDA